MVVWNSLRGKPPPFLFLFFFLATCLRVQKTLLKKLIISITQRNACCYDMELYAEHCYLR